MALKAMYKGFKKVLAPLIINRPGELAIDQDALNAELNTVFFPRSEQAAVGAKNFLPITLASIKALNPSREWDDNVTTHNGVTYTVNTNASGYLTSVETSGTATGYSFLRLCSVSQFNGSFILNGGVDSGKFVYIQNETTNTGLAYSYGTDSDVVNLSPTANTVNCIIAYNQGASGNATFKPMLRLATDSDPTYEPYAMTNRELTDKVVKHALIDIALESTISKNQGEEVQALNSYDLRNSIPNINEALSVEYMWSNGSRCVSVNQYLSGRYYTLVLLALAAVSVSTVRLNVTYI